MSSPPQRSRSPRTLGTVGRVVAVSAVAMIALGVRTYMDGYTAKNLEQINAARALAHFDHAPRHGGLVLMNGDTHFEVVLDRTGQYRVYFSDAVRTALPAAVASQVHVAVTPNGGAPDNTPLQIDAAGTHWTGRGPGIVDPNAVARITYIAQQKPYWIDVPASAWPGVIASLP